MGERPSIPHPPRKGPEVVVVLDDGGLATAVARAGEEQAGRVVVLAAPGEGGPSESLLGACREAAKRGARRVVWPVWCGGDAAALHAAFERAFLIQKLAALDAGPGRGIAVETPFADLTEARLRELAEDLDVALPRGM
ncbi:MAG: hypothetical protein IBJ11_12610 [Phycisphaerales bacterium]|nr:hypothetical protein [Phycisphaerales bacterium]